MDNHFMNTPNQHQPEQTPLPHQPPQSPSAPDFMAPPPPPQPVFSPHAPTPPPEPPAAQQGIVPQPVVQVLSPRGVEYVFLTIALIAGAIGLITALLSLVNGETGFGTLTFPVSILLVSVPVFAWLFLRLKKAELLDPSLQLDASKRRSTQFIQIVSFLTVFFTLIGLVTTVLAKISGNYDGSIVKVILDVLVLLLVAGGILFYYWRDEHQR